jgi:hypothetical protein
MQESPSAKNTLITSSEYNKKYSNMELENRKVLASLLRKKTIT